MKKIIFAHSVIVAILLISPTVIFAKPTIVGPMGASKESMGPDVWTGPNSAILSDAILNPSNVANDNDGKFEEDTPPVSSNGDSDVTLLGVNGDIELPHTVTPGLQTAIRDDV
ncbi:MAG: hypothetical protein P9X27_05810, partial [Candidatus Kaelpia aquatica]|nr:hypothetical protein [Candidatus Kaelpia aquatica]